MRVFLLVFGCVLFFVISVYGDQAQQQAMQQSYKEFVQVDAQIESLLKQKLELKAQVMEHMEREQMSVRPRVERRQEEQINGLYQQIQALSEQISGLEEKRSNILMSL